MVFVLMVWYTVSVVIKILAVGNAVVIIIVVIYNTQ